MAPLGNALLGEANVPVAGQGNSSGSGGNGGNAGRFATLAATMAQAIPTLTDFNGSGVSVFPNGNPTASFQAIDAKLPGGAVTAANGKDAAISNAVVFVNVTTVSWAVGVYGQLQVSTAGHFNLLGLVGDTSDYGVATYSVADATKYVLYTFKSGGPETFTVSNVTCDGKPHFFVVAFDSVAGKISLYIDGIQAASMTTLGQLHNADVYLGLTNTIQGDAILFLGGVGFTA